MESILVGKRDAAESVLCALLCNGHVLIEDVPGTGKTTLATSLAHLLGCSFQRVQFTPDLMPSDLTGFSVMDAAGKLSFHSGLVFHQILLADEINRASPKTQSALLEAMQERQVTVDGKTYRLDAPFLVLATQNPVDHVGTFPLPEAQLDRFFMRVSLGYPTLAEETEILEQHDRTSSENRQPLAPMLTSEDVLALQASVASVYAAAPLKQYIAAIAAATREHRDLRLGASTRGAIYLMTAAKGLAWLKGRDYATPADVKRAMPFVLPHRIHVSSEARLRDVTPESVLREIAAAVPVPEA
jgi:MoxR-like ATPase